MSVIKLDVWGDHGLMCPVGGRRTRRHDNLCDTAIPLFERAGFHVAKEVRVPAWDVPAGGRRRQDLRAVLDLRLESPPDEPLVYCDVVVAHPKARGVAAAAAASDGAAAARAEADKHRRYPDGRVPLGRLVPLAVEPYGRWGDEALRLFKAAAARTVARTAALGNLGDTAAPAVLGSMMARLSVSLQRGNAECARAAIAEEPPVPAEAPDWEAAIADLLAYKRAEAHVASSVGA